jgi:formylmethanofuran dehydrogenase subunit E
MNPDHKKEESFMTICGYLFDEYTERIRAFHTFAAPGVILGGFMVDLAYKHLPSEGLFDALCETAKCLPDAIQLLTPCTIGNGWLTVVNIGRYAMTFYEKSTGEGVRVAMDTGKLDEWPEIKGWFLKLKPKEEQEEQRLIAEIENAGSSIYKVQLVTVTREVREKKHRAGFAICPQCGEAYPVTDGPSCLGCLYPLWELSGIPSTSVTGGDALSAENR